MIRRPPRSTLFPYHDALPICRPPGRAAPAPGGEPGRTAGGVGGLRAGQHPRAGRGRPAERADSTVARTDPGRSEEHTSELQSRQYLVCRLLLEKKKTNVL